MTFRNIKDGREAENVWNLYNLENIDSNKLSPFGNFAHGAGLPTYLYDQPTETHIYQYHDVADFLENWAKMLRYKAKQLEKRKKDLTKDD